MKLARSKAKFDGQIHTYSLDDRELSGITRLIRERIMPQKYADIPVYILEAAAKRGTEIHSACSIYDMFDEISTEYQEVGNYAKLLESNSIKILEDEYLVNNEHYATRIDKVGGDYSLYDIKTTASLDKQYLSWQLSIGAHLFEHQNPGLKVPALYGIWLRGEKAALVEVPRIPDEHILALFKADREGFDFENPLRKEVDIDIEQIIQIESIIQDLKTQVEDLEVKKSTFLDSITGQMADLEMKKLETDSVAITVVADTVSKRFDALKFKEADPDLYKKYEVENIRKGGVRVKLK